MNPWQLAQQIKAELQTVTWPAVTLGDDEKVVFGKSVAIFAGFPTEDQIPKGWPWVLISIDTATNDDDTPELIEQSFGLMTAAKASGDTLGEFAIIGSNAADLGSSAGRGVAEVMERIRAAVGDLTAVDGASVVVSSASTAGILQFGRGKHMAIQEVTLTGLCTSALYYAAPQNLQYDVNWTWSGAHCSDRFDFVKYRIVEKLGTTPSTDPTDGTTVYTGTSTSATGSWQVGYTYTVFADYSSRRRTSSGAIVVEGSSGPEVGAYRVVA